MNQNKRIKYIITIVAISICSFGVGCKKLVTLDGTGDQLSADQVFSNDGTANNAVAGVYQYLNTYLFTSTSVTAYLGMAADELYSFTASPLNEQYSNNTLQSNTDFLPWQSPYQCIYQANAILEGVRNNDRLSPAGRDRYEGEALCLRAYCYFYLVNLFGDVPLILSTSVSENSRFPRTPTNEVYAQIVADLTTARTVLPTDYNASGGSKTRINYWGATALLARIQLYRGEWRAAYALADEVINSGSFQLISNLDDFSLQNNDEAIWQFALQETEGVYEPNMYVSGDFPLIPFRPSFISTFEPGDARLSHWVKWVDYVGVQYPIPNKYKSSAPGTERYNLLRLAELYLVRAEASAQMEDIASAVTDINVLRSRAGLLPISDAISKVECLQAIAHERQVELFAETGHRWLDLKRTGQLDAVLQPLKSATWAPHAALFPIPLADLQNNPQLEQNPGY